MPLVLTAPPIGMGNFSNILSSALFIFSMFFMTKAALRHGAEAVWTLRQRAAPWVETIAALDLSRGDRISVVTGEPATTVLLDPARADRNLTEYLALQDDLLDRIGPVSYVDLRWRDRISIMPNGVSDAQQ